MQQQKLSDMRRELGLMEVGVFDSVGMFLLRMCCCTGRDVRTHSLVMALAVLFNVHIQAIDFCALF